VHSEAQKGGQSPGAPITATRPAAVGKHTRAARRRGGEAALAARWSAPLTLALLAGQLVSHRGQLALDRGQLAAQGHALGARGCKSRGRAQAVKWSPGLCTSKSGMQGTSKGCLAGTLGFSANFPGNTSAPGAACASCERSPGEQGAACTRPPSHPPVDPCCSFASAFSTSATWRSRLDTSPFSDSTAAAEAGASSGAQAVTERWCN
jgi:hypothetical protein